MQQQRHQIVYCTCPDLAAAQTIADSLVDEGLAACVSILPGVHSTYRWQGQRESAQEVLLMIKTTTAAYQQLETRVLRLHPYELPELIAVPITQGLAAYLAWIDDNTNNENLT